MNDTEDTAPEHRPSAQPAVSAELSYLPFINLAVQQNALPVVYEMKLVNRTDEDLEHLECVFSSPSNLIREKTVAVDLLKAKEELPVHDIGIELDHQLLATISEALKGKMTLEIRRGGTVLFGSSFDLTAFAADQWLGLRFIPELICAFVTPNLDAVNHLLTLAAEELKRETGSAALCGYQAGRRRAYEICSAVYRAIHSWGIHYANPASSFGTAGQRIRFADTIYKFRLGTCLDTTLLFASVLEQCGLHPVIMLQSGHAYIGCHLEERYFSDIPMDDLQAIRKLVELDEFLVLETTLVTSDAPFSEAERTARTTHLSADEDFHCAIDVVRARFSGIHPLPLKRSAEGIEFETPDTRPEKLAPEQERDLRQEIDLSALEKNSQRTGRIARWTQKLLDLSLRNRLLNVRDTKFIIPVACPDITVLEDILASDESMSLNSLTELLGAKDLNDLAVQRPTDIQEEIRLLLEKELHQRRLWTLLPPGEMNRRLTALYRQGKTDLEEGGVNTLFLGVGFLEWKVSSAEERSCLAPILLIPVRLKRKSIVEGIRISRIDEETIINETLLELLRVQFHLTIPGLSPLPLDDSGVDVGRVMQIFRQTIKDMAGWEVREEVRLGLFSFGKFVMWTDMTARADLLRKNPLVDHLIEGGGLFDDGIPVFPPEEIAEHLDPGKLYCPLSADSSQLTAVLYSTLGKTFVLHGPPGTGKSQTITNIITQNLAMGRRVLFVSEKKAALEVVHQRLSAIGLRPFCLELHSSKSGKSEVLAQFSEALNVQDIREPEEWRKTVSDLQTLRGELNDYVQALHKKYPNGLSAYDCFQRLLPERESPGDPLDISCLDQPREAYEKLLQLVSDLAHACAVLSPEDLPHLDWLDAGEWSPVFERRLTESARQLLDATAALAKDSSDFRKNTGLPDSDRITDIYQSVRLAEALKESCDIPELLLDESIADNAAFLHLFRQTAENVWDLEKKLGNYNRDVIGSLDIPGIRKRLRENARAFFVLRFFRNSALLKELAGLKKIGGGKLTVRELDLALPDFELWTENAARYANMLPKARSLLGKVWQDEATDWSKLARLIDSVENILGIVQKLSGGTGELGGQVLAALRPQLADAEKRFARGSGEREKINAFLTVWNRFQECFQNFSALSGSAAAIDALGTLDEKLRGTLAHISGLRGVMRYKSVRNSLAGSGLDGFISSLESGKIPVQEAAAAFGTAYARSMLDQILFRERTLARFNSLDHEQRIRKFCELDDRCTECARKIVFAKLASALPRRRSGPCPEGTELGLLKRECEKKTRQRPVRQLLMEIPNIAPILKPCFLMSPLSVAQYLPPDSAPFDLIVFDEASQIPVWDAIGVIARGKQLIVVGDPKQMPPTNFFQKQDSPEGDAETDELEDMESILDECLAAGVYSAYLNWHYRSRHEALISFSNHYYYGDRLFTFPAAHASEKLGIRFEFVPQGVYDRCGSRTNRKEAQALVDCVFRLLESPGGQKRSIGIVTFSEAQKNLIEDLLERERAKHPQLEACFSDQNETPLFVKNLENVQGDERDVILFSICYAPDAAGKFSMNFGPLNRQGGERRLNVAITRAREQIIVFSSIHAQQIDPARTNAVGASHLKFFLDYAEKGFRMQSGGSAETRKDVLADVIEEFLSEHGFAVERNVGNSGYRIDLAVKNPDRENEFLLGIECDGPAYAAQKTTRDRDHLRHAVLRSLNWRIRQAWTLDWVFDRKQAEAALLEEIEKARTAPPDLPAEEPPEDAGETQEPPPEETVPEPPPEKIVNRYAQAVISCDRPQEFFYEGSARGLIRQQMLEVVRQEGPVCEKLLKKRIVKAWNFNRAGETIQNILNACLPGDLPTTRFGDENVYWPSGTDPAQYRQYRVNSPDCDKRAIDEIPPEELANAMYEVLTDFQSCEQDALFRETVRLFGFSAVTQKARKYLETALTTLRQTGRV